MSYTTKPFEKLDLLDDFLMNAIACDEQVGIPCCRKLLSVLLQKEIGICKKIFTFRSITASIRPRSTV